MAETLPDAARQLVRGLTKPEQDLALVLAHTMSEAMSQALSDRGVPFERGVRIIIAAQTLALATDIACAQHSAGVEGGIDAISVARNVAEHLPPAVAALVLVTQPEGQAHG